jgi:hypothetical protein
MYYPFRKLVGLKWKGIAGFMTIFLNETDRFEGRLKKLARFSFYQLDQSEWRSTFTNV